jgi:outer membrane protein OmpA-like peptidoglycan-associated protein
MPMKRDRRPRSLVAFLAFLTSSTALAQMAPPPAAPPPPVPAAAPPPGPAAAPPGPAAVPPPGPAAAPAPEEEPEPPMIQRLPPGPPPPPPPARRSRRTAAPVAAVPEGPPPAVIPDSFLPSLMGPIGLYHMATAEVGPVTHLRLALHFDYFKTDGFLVQGDKNSRVDGNFSFGFTPHEYFEIFGAMLTSSNRNVRSAVGEPPRRDPELIKSFGDLVLGGKTALPVARGQNLGFLLGFRFLSSISDLSVSPSSTSLWLGPLYTVDLRPLADVPLRLHGSIDFYLDNSHNLINFNDPTISIFTREVASFAYGIQKSRMRFAFGAEVPLEQATAPVPLDLFGEYHAEVVTASGDFAPFDSAGFTHPRNRDQQWLTFGVRARIFQGITLDAGMDFRIRSVGYAYGPPLPPWVLRGGLSYPFDIASFIKPTIVTKTVEKPVATGPAAPLEAPVVGVVKSTKDGKGIPNAIVSIVGKPLSRVGTDPDGSFQTHLLPPGPVVLDVSAPGHEAARVNAAVILTRPTKVEVTLQVRVATGNVRGRVTDGKGQPLQASLRFTGAEAFSAQADAQGNFSAALPVGPYRVTAEMPAMPPKEASLDIIEGQDKTLDIVMGGGGAGLGAPAVPATLNGDVVTPKTALKFKGTKLDAKMQASLDGVAALLAEHPELRVLKVDVYWDNSAGPKAKSMTDAQAKAIKDYLVKKGVSEGRIDAAGHGADNPLVPNIGPVNKGKNRRVELHIAQ